VNGPEEFKYCPYCKTKLEEKEIEGRVRAFCPSCNYIHYINPLPSAGAIAFNEENKIILIKRGREPAKGLWAPPSGFIEIGETTEDACLRELKEESGVDGEIVNLLSVYTKNAGFYGDVLIIMYIVKVISGDLVAGDDADAVGFFDFNEIPEFPFPCFNDAVIKAKEFLNVR